MRKKLIEVALPLEAINRESAREKSIRHGHPSTLHLWWARRPLAACRAVLFASLIDDPDQDGVPQSLLDRIDQLPLPDTRGPDWASLPIGEQRRRRLFQFIERLVPWERGAKDDVLSAARELVAAATNGNPPPGMDPFCGGGSIPLEAQRLGLVAHASDLNPVAVLITKALIEIPSRFAGQPPVSSAGDRPGIGAAWKATAGLAADVHYYGRWIRDEAERRLGHLYPKVKLPKEYGGGDATVIAWLWARTAQCPNPACGAQMPLIRSLSLSTKASNRAWLEPTVDQTNRTVRFTVRTGQGSPAEPPKVGRGAQFRCLVCRNVADERHIKDQGMKGAIGAQLLAIVAESRRGRVYLPADVEHERVSESAHSAWRPDQPLADDPRNIWCVQYGIDTFDKLFTSRQLVALTTISDLVGEAREQVYRHAVAVGLPDDDIPLDNGGAGATAYADAVATYLGIIASKATVFHNTLSRWRAGEGKSAPAFGRQAIPMVWDFAEVNPFAGAGGDLSGVVDGTVKALGNLPSAPAGYARQLDATEAVNGVRQPLIVTDPPYYDNISYADLSDFFYVWLRRSLGDVYPNLFSTLLTPKGQELIATPYRFGGSKDEARRFFERGLGKAFASMRASQDPDYPLIVYYAFKQAEMDEDDSGEEGDTAVFASTGWETMLEGLLDAGFAITGTWPSRTEGATRMIAMGTNALASSIVLVCRPRETGAALATRREFVAALKRELPEALRKLQHGNIAPVDLAQAAIGPGMAVFSRFSKVVDASGQPLSVRAALQLINQALDEVLMEQESEYDPATRWAVSWFEQFGMNDGLFGDAETLSKAKDVAVAGLEEVGILRARGGKVRLLRRDELPADWDPTKDRRVTVWEIAQHLIRAQQSHGDGGAASLLAKVGGLGEIARDLAYRLFMTCERKGWAPEALAYNGLVVAWPDIARLATAAPTTPAQGRLI
jgi:putative DNA methylase